MKKSQDRVSKLPIVCKGLGRGIYFLLFIFLFQSCGDGHKKTTKNTNIQSKDFQDKLINANKMYVRQESD